MTNYVTAETIRSLRTAKRFTQEQLASTLNVTSKAVSKWETGRGVPDIALLEPLAKALGVSVAELLAGECVVNANRSANMMRSVFYVCPLCGNVVHAMGAGSFTCCGEPMLPQEAEEFDDAHALTIEKVEHDYYVTMDHVMTKNHYISFLAYVTSDRATLVKLYPEQDVSVRFPICGTGMLYAYCNQHGLFKVRVTPQRKSAPSSSRVAS
ncbi:MAG: helix-turn-helix domain-containing protein [Eggerthellaceae bacterium]